MRRFSVCASLVLAMACAAPVGPAESVRISSGIDHTCVVGAGSGVKCWGWNFLGQLGSGSSPDALAQSALPLTVMAEGEALEGIQEVASGDAHTCSVGTQGRVFCWGDNLTGALGAGTEAFFASSAIEVALPAPATRLASGNGHTCAVLEDGSLACWGSNFFGQLGVGTADNAFVPEFPSSDERYVDIAAGGGHTCALEEGGHAYCWGDNLSGQVGDGTTITRRTPTLVSADVEFSQVAAGMAHSCAVGVGGSVYCWGSNEFGQLGMEGEGDRRRPARVSGLPDARAVSAGLRHTCMLSRAATVYCWGNNTSRQAAPIETARVSEPQQIMLDSPVAQLALGAAHTCAMTRDDQVLCWGNGGRGQLGNDVDASVAPLLVAYSE